MKRRKKNKPPDVMSYYDSDILKKENSILRKIIKNKDFYQQIYLQIEMNKEELNGIEAKKKISKSEWATKIAEIEDEIEKVEPKKEAREYILIVLKKKAFLKGLKTGDKQAGQVCNSVNDLNFYLDETLAKRAIENLIEKGFSPKLFL